MKHLLALVLLSASISAMACGEPGGQSCAPTIQPQLVNQGAICNQVKSSASVSGIGSSLSFATGSASAISNGSQTATSPTSTSRTLDLTGVTSASNTGVAYNVSTGNGTGSASSTGSASAQLSNAANASYNTNGASGTLHVQGTSDSNSNIGIVAGKNQGGAAQSTTTGTFVVHGDVSATKTGNTVAVAGNVSDTKTTQSEVLTGKVQNSATGEPVTYLAPATTTGNASTVVNAAGSFKDPAHF